MKRSQKNNQGMSSQNAAHALSNDKGVMPANITLQTSSSYTTILAGCYDAILWMGGNIKQLDRMLDWLI
ncbi:MAG TPA: hypothetical protein VL442_06990 [Mucilaginibacter sp.]|jgi:hypothetical protein|nr:hypothetical protein [Mucilaginibacter sp.]